MLLELELVKLNCPLLRGDPVGVVTVELISGLRAKSALASASIVLKKVARRSHIPT
jgi:hypothetical protein